jgi:hypothetical protein
MEREVYLSRGKVNFKKEKREISHKWNGTLRRLIINRGV